MRGLGIDDDADNEAGAASKDDTGAAAPPASDAKLERQSRRATARETNLRRIAELEQEVQSLRASSPEREAAIQAAAESARAEERERLEREAQQAERARTEAAASQRAEAEAALFRQACRMEDHDPRLGELVQGDPEGRTLYQWREDRKTAINRYPDAEAAIRADARLEVAEELDALRAAQSADRQRLAREIQRAASLPHVRPEDLLRTAADPLDTWDKMAGYFHRAGAASKAAELEPKLAERDETIAARDATIAELQNEIRDLKLVGPRGLGSGRAPVAPGQPAAANGKPRGFDPGRGWRENLAASLMGSDG